MAEKIAVHIRQLDGFTGDAALYRVSPAMRTYDEREAYEYVVVSATFVSGKPETYIFGSDEDGEVLNWLELPGSFRGGLDHEVALNGAGYRVE